MIPRPNADSRYLDLVPAIEAELTARGQTIHELFQYVRHEVLCGKSSFYRYLKGDAQMPPLVRRAVIDFLWPEGLPAYVWPLVILPMVPLGPPTARPTASPSSKTPLGVWGRLRIHTITLAVEPEVRDPQWSSGSRLKSHERGPFKHGVRLRSGARLRWDPWNRDAAYGQVELEADRRAQ